jgi:predicted peptidase
VAKYAVDADRIYLTGLSVGGYGVWRQHTPSILLPCGGGDPEKAGCLKDMPVWVFHGAKDTVVSPEQSEKMVDALKAVGGNVRFTLYPDAAHDSWTQTLRQSRDLLLVTQTQAR